MSLRRAAFAGVRWTTASSLFRSGLQFIQIGILARMLTPEDFGVVALVVAITVFLQMFAELGVNNAIVHHSELTQHQLSSLYWLSVLAGGFAALTLGTLAEWIALLYGQPILKSLLYLAAISIAANAVGLVLRAVAQKNLRFEGLAKVEIAAGGAGFVTAVAVGASGGGPYALVFAVLATVSVSSVLTWRWLAQGWRPSLRLRLGEIGHLVRFGSYVIANNIVSTLNHQADVLIGGRILGPQAIGLYSVSKELSFRISGVFNPAITQVGLPVMAKGQADAFLLRRIYLQTLRMSASVNFPFYVALAVFSQEVVSLLLGDQWKAAVGLLQVLAWWGLLRSIGNPVGSLLMALGRARLSFWWNVIWFAITVPSVWLGSQYGTGGLAWVAAGLVALNFVPNWYYLVRPLCGARLLEYCCQVAIPLLLALVAAGVAIVTVQDIHESLPRLLAGLFTIAATYGILSWFFNRVWVNSMLELVGGARK